MTTEIKKLLPQGFYDHLDDLAYMEIKLNFSLVEHLHRLGFKLVRPAMMEFEGALDPEFRSKTYKVTDPISGKMMAIRSDITPQISRIVKDKYLASLTSDKKEIKISYTGQILKKYGSNKFNERQLTQTGFEIIGGEVDEKNTQVLATIKTIFDDINIDNYTIDFSLPALSKLIFKRIGLSKSEESEAQNLIEEKNISTLKQNAKLSVVTEIVEVYEKAYSVKTAISALEKIENLLEKDTEKSLILELKTLLINSDIKDINLNLLEKANFDYHKGVCFSVISKESYEEIGRGGRYTIKNEETSKNHSAVGFTFMLNPILRVKTDA